MQQSQVRKVLNNGFRRKFVLRYLTCIATTVFLRLVNSVWTVTTKSGEIFLCSLITESERKTIEIISNYNVYGKNLYVSLLFALDISYGG